MHAFPSPAALCEEYAPHTRQTAIGMPSSQSLCLAVPVAKAWLEWNPVPKAAGQTDLEATARAEPLPSRAPHFMQTHLPALQHGWWQ